MWLVPVALVILAIIYDLIDHDRVAKEIDHGTDPHHRRDGRTRPGE